MNETTVSKSEQVHPATQNGIEVGSSMPAVSEPNEAIQKVVVAVHGIGDQFSFATIQSVVNQFCVYFDQPAAIPLGSFHSGQPAYSLTQPYPPEPFGRLAFAEVYWASIARSVEDEKHTLEEAKTWARTIVERLRMRWREEENKREWQGERKVTCHDEDFKLTQQVLGEMIQTIAVVERICFLADKAGLFTFDLKKLLDDYLGDVQIVAEFKEYRDKILATFAKLLDNLEKAFPKADIYFVAHSEGTVVALLGLLEALRKPVPPGWTRKVKGLMTLGSPIDKHLALWPELFGDAPPSPKALEGLQKIEWRNYYDFGDPVGFKLDGIREWIEVHDWKGVFNFEGDKHDFGFTRYPFPGKAHVDYWTDRAVFDHFISTVVVDDNDRDPKGGQDPNGRTMTEPLPALPSGVGITRKGPMPAPSTLKRYWLTSYAIPYVGIFVLLFIAAYVLYKAVTDAIGGTTPQASSLIFIRSLGIAALLYGVTIMSRIPRLTYETRLWVRAFAISGLGALVYMLSVRDNEATLLRNFPVPPGTITLGLAILVALLAFVVSAKRPSWGLIPLMATGMVAVVVTVFYYVKNTGGPVWPIFLATGAFLYLWWLSALLFDLIFVWHLYIRNSKLVDRINQILGTYKERVGALPSEPVQAV